MNISENFIHKAKIDRSTRADKKKNSFTGEYAEAVKKISEWQQSRGRPYSKIIM